MADRAVVMESGKIIAADTPLQNRQPPVGAGPRYVFRHAGPGAGLYGAQGTGPLPLTVREGRNWPRWRALEFRPIPEGAVVSLRKKCSGASARRKGVFAIVGGNGVHHLEGSASQWGGEATALSLKELWFRYERNSPDVLRGVSAEVPEGSLLPLWAATERGNPPP